MIKYKIKKYIKKAVIVILIILAVLVILNLYGTFIQPLIHPYFFKMDIIEKLIETNLPLSSHVIEYEIIAEPSYTIGKTKGIKEIYAKVDIKEDVYELLKEEWEFNGKYSEVEKLKEAKKLELLNIENVEEINIRQHYAHITKVEYAHGFWRSYWYPGWSTSIFIILTKEEIDDYVMYSLYVFNDYFYIPF